jgi:YebC/PmpR family DNA-binding regulatory protein
VAGHSKWANIKHRKGKADALKGKAFSRATKEIISAVKQGGPDPKNNPKLRMAILKAKEINLPSENIERNIKKASSTDQSDFFEVTYEFYGMGGVGIIIEGLTDNKNRMASDMRIATNKRGGSIATPGSVLFNFDKKGVILLSKEGLDTETLLGLILEAGADDFEEDEEHYVVLTDPSALYAVKEALEAKNVQPINASLEYLPKSSIEVDEETRAANLALIEWLEALDDVDLVFHNMS